MSTTGTTTYTIEEVTMEYLENNFNRIDFTKYISTAGPELTRMFDYKLDWVNTPIKLLIEKCIFLVCRRNGEIRGHMICRITTNPLDLNIKMLTQVSFYVKPNSGRTAYHLFQKFIDIGKDRANHIITMLTSQTNIKPSTLENLGFKEVEMVYRMEIIK
jgi:hypothetical protein